MTRTNGTALAIQGETVTHRWERSEPLLSVKVERNSRGYNWEISLAGQDPSEVLQRIHDLNAALSAEYGPKTEGD